MECKIFNVGMYRRQAAAQLAGEQASERQAAGACDANFFDPNNTEAATMREHVAELALRDMLSWLDGDDEESMNGERTGTPAHVRRYSSMSNLSSDNAQSVDRIAIFDATNSTEKRRRWILEECTSPEKRAGKPTGVVFVESLCDDQELIDENFRYKVANSPDFKGMGVEEAMEDLRKRVKKYEDQYETITDDSQSYIKMFNLSTKLFVNHIYGRMAKTIVPALMAWNTGSRPIFLCRPGETPHGVRTDAEDYVAEVDQDDPSMVNMSSQARRKSVKGYSLGPGGIAFREELYNFIEKESTEFAKSRGHVQTGTSRTGLANSSENDFEFPISVYTSTMPRAVQTVEWAKAAGVADELSNLNPLDKGDFNGMELEESREVDPAWYSRLEQDPFHVRFPGGECYADLIHRLETIIVEMEQQMMPVLIVSHVSTLQLLIAYFRGSPVEKSMSIEVPMHTVLKFKPSRGGGWSESIHRLSPRTPPQPPVRASSSSDLSAMSLPPSEQSPVVSPRTPIWGDHNSSNTLVSHKIALA